MKKYLITGLIILIPIALTFMIARWLFDLFTDPFIGLVAHLFSTQDNYVQIIGRLISLALLLLLTLFLGLCGRKLFSKILDKILLRIPIIRTIYRLISEITTSVLAEDKKTFQQTVLIPFPNDSSRAIGFITGETPDPIRSAEPTAEISIFLPTAPHPISGFVLLSPKIHAKHVDITTEEAFKYLISCGVIHPGEPIQKKE